MLRSNRLLWIALPVGLLFLLDLSARAIAEVLWFREVGHLSALLTRAGTSAGLGAAVLGLALLLLGGNLQVADRCRSPEDASAWQAHWQQSPGKPVGALRLSWLLVVAVAIAAAIAVLLGYYASVSGDFFRSDWALSPAGQMTAIPSRPEDYALPGFGAILPAPPGWAALQRTRSQLALESALLPLFGGALVVALLLWTRWVLRAIAVVLSCFFAAIVAANWTRVLGFLEPTPFGQVDPLFGRDIGFYVFRLPVWELLAFCLGGASIFALLSASLTYLLAGESLSHGKFPGFTYPQLRHLYLLGSLTTFSLVLRHVLARFELLFSPRGVTYGASYADIRVQLPVETTLSLIATATGIWLLLRALTVVGRRRILGRSPWVGLGLYAGATVLGATLSPAVQRLEVQPNELNLELPFIERSIAFTRAAFRIDRIDARTFDPAGELDLADLRANARTIRNIRLWDARPLLQTNRQLQQIRLYYRFPDADVDRYTLLAEASEAGFETGNTTSNFSEPDASDPSRSEGGDVTLQQVLIAARELDFSAVPEQAQTWVNEHLIYTHGYGFTLSPVNRAAPSGLPEYYVKDIATGVLDEAGALATASEAVRNSVPIGKPRIYYGELTDSYVMTDSRREELDFPSGDDNVYTTYDGTGGIELGSPWRRLVFALYLRDWRMLLSRNLTPDTRLLMRRNIRQRLQAIAPFLRFDGDPYLVTVDDGEGDPDTRNYLHWIVDAYTVSDRYPYADPGPYPFNYIRNSVKIVVDAYSGRADFYVADPSDPIVQTWERVFPGLFQPLATMPVTLRSHIRYPLDLYRVQAEQLLTYHMTDPQVFYNREDQWSIPRETYGDEQQTVEPYYLVVKLPDADSEEFVLLMPFTPVERSNAIAWMAGRSDEPSYGKQLLYRFPKQRLVYGPQQIEALIDQDPVISQQISLWNRQDSRAVRGNLLVIPIERSLLYVEPVYLQAESNSLPTLARVIVVYKNQIAMAETLDAALEAIFDPAAAAASSDTTPILRPVEGPPIEPPNAPELPGATEGNPDSEAGDRAEDEGSAP